jgi:hypothetical protein
MLSRPRGCFLHLAVLSSALLLGQLVQPHCVFAQSESASVSGRVTDQSNALMPDVEVEIKNADTGVSQAARTNGEGFYVFPALKPGNYLMGVRKQSFRTVSVTGITLNVQDKLSRNFVLQVGSSAESITVTAEGVNINTQDATVSTVVDRQFAENLPMNGRSFQPLIELTPGVVLVPSNAGDSGQFSVNGQRAASNYWMVDGVSANIGVGSSNVPGNGVGGTLGSFSVVGGTNSLVSIDAMQEFRIQTSTYAPEFGRTPGGQISIVTLSGANQFHGTAFDYLRNDVLDANNWFNGYTNDPPSPKAEERQNDFGGTLSGPVLKDRTFFFFSYEGLRLRLPQTALTTVPDLSARQNAVPAMQPFLNAFPFDPNQPDLGNGIAQFNASFSNPATLDAYSLRIDHKFNDKLTLFGRYNYSPSELVQRGNGLSLSTVYPFRITTQTATVGVTWTLPATVTNDLRFNYSRTNGQSRSYLDNFGGAVPLPSPPFPSPFTVENAGFGLFIYSLSANGNQISAGPNAQNIQRQTNVVDNLSVQRDSHTLKFGVDFRRLSPLVARPSYVQAASFLDVPSAEIGNILFGSVESSADLTLLFRNLGVFAQDTWRMFRRLTLTYGLRWDVDSAPSSLDGPSIPAVMGYNLNDLSHLAIAPSGTPPFKTTYANLAPRLGVAYQITNDQKWETVLRGGFGVFYDLVGSETGALVSSGTPPFAAIKSPSGTFPYAPAQAAPPPIPPTGSISFLAAFNPNLQLPYTLGWNVALEQDLGGQQTLSASYIGASGRRLLQTTLIDAPTKNPSVIGDFVDNTAVSDYNALQVQFQRRLSHGLQVLASYTWSHSTDTGSAASVFNEANTGGLGKGNRGPSDFDIRNGFSLGLTYDIPAPRINGFANAILRGWSTENFILARSAPPLNITDTNFFSGFTGGIYANIRPDVVPGQPLYLYGSQCADVLVNPLVPSGQNVPSCPGGKGINPSAFTDPPSTIDPTTGSPVPSRQGDLGRNSLRGFGATEWDLAVHREFLIHESLKLQFRAEMFNVLNHPNFGQPSGSFGQGGFGLSSVTLGQSLAGNNLGGGGLSPLYQVGGPRSIQFALKVSF